jgi:hypothetical protein
VLFDLLSILLFFCHRRMNKRFTILLAAIVVQLETRLQLLCVGFLHLYLYPSLLAAAAAAAAERTMIATVHCVL